MIATAKHKSGSSGDCLGYMLGDKLEKDQKVRVVAYEGFALSRLKIAEIESIPSTEEEKAAHKKAVWQIANNLSKVFDARTALADYRVNDPLEDYVVSFVDEERARLRRSPTGEERDRYGLPKLEEGETDERALERIVLEEFLARIGVHGEIEKRLRRKGENGKKYTVTQNVQRQAMFLAVAHDGTAHPHLHVLTARPDANGMVNDTREEHRRILATVKRLSKKYNLSMKLEGYKVDLEKTNEGYAAMIMARNSAQDALKTATTREEFKEMLAGAGVIPTWLARSRTGEEYGILFMVTDKHGKKHTWSGSQLDRALSYGKVNAALARNLATRQEAAAEALAEGAAKRGTVGSRPESSTQTGAPVKPATDAQRTGSFRPETKMNQPSATASPAPAPVKKTEEKTEVAAAKKAQAQKKAKKTKQAEKRARQEERKQAKQAEQEALQQRISAAFALFEKLDAFRNRPVLDETLSEKTALKPPADMPNPQGDVPKPAIWDEKSPQSAGTTGEVPAQKPLQGIPLPAAKTTVPGQKPPTGASRPEEAAHSAGPAVRGTGAPRPEPVVQAAVPTSRATMPEEGMSNQKETGQNANSLEQSVAQRAADTSLAETAAPTESTMPVKGAGGVHRETVPTRTAAPAARASEGETGMSNAEPREAKPVATQKQASEMTSAQSASRPEPTAQGTGASRPELSAQAGAPVMRHAAPNPGARISLPDNTVLTAGQGTAIPAGPKTLPKIIFVTPKNYGSIPLPEGYRVHEEDGFIIMTTPALVENNLVVEGKGYVLVHKQDGSYECRTAERHEQMKGNQERYKRFNQPDIPVRKEQRNPKNKLR